MNHTIDQNESKQALVVDDDVTIRLLARETLELAGFTVTEAAGGEEALSLFADLQPDVILLDVMMPGIDGFTVCRHIRNQPEGGNVALLMMTGLNDVDSIKKAYEVGATDFITKPINWQILGYRANYIYRATQTFQELSQSRAQLLVAQKIARLASWNWDRANDKFHWSDELYHIFGIDPSAGAGTYDTFINAIHPLDKEHVKTAIEEAVATGQTFSLDYRIILANGEERFVMTEGHPIVDQHGRQDQTTGTVQDISERKLAEAQLADSEMELRSLFNAMTDVVLILDHQGRYLKIAPTSPQFLYRPAKNLIGKRLHEVFPVQEADSLLANIKTALEKMHTIDVEYSMEIDGRTTWFEGKVSPVTDKSVIWVARDITDRKRAEEGRIEMERRLLHSQKLESLGVLAGGIAHDFNNLLMTILGNLDLAMEDISPVAPARPYLENTRNASLRGADLIRQMLAYSGKGNFVVEHLNLSELVKENFNMFRSLIPTTIALNLHLTHDIYPIMADVGQIQQVVMNLITNGAEAIGDKVGTINITTGVQTCDDEYLKQSRLPEKPPPGDFVYFEVTDTGCGMNEETQKKIFDPFFTTKFTGRGLGMSAIQGIILAHKGAIFLDSKIEKGTVIRVIFPVSDTVPETKALIIPKQEASLTSDIHPLPGLILVVDDEDDVRQLCNTMVARIGYRTLAARDGEEAIKVFRDHAEEIACIILDMTMPKMDGYTTFQALQQLCPDVKVIISSGYNEEVIAQRFTGMGLAGFIQKPYRRQRLQDELERVMNGG